MAPAFSKESQAGDSIQMMRKKKILAILVRKLGTRRPQSLWHRYVIGFLIIFMTVSVSHWATVATIAAAEDDAEVISVSAGQRMLSQRILFLMSETDHDRDPHVDQRLEAALNLFESSHNWLVARPDLSPALQQLYFESEPIALDAFSRRFVQLVGIASTSEGAQKEELSEIVAKWGTEDLLAALATAADLFQQESEARVARLQLIQKLTLLAALVVLLFEALLIFLPAQISVNQAFERLERRKQHLKSSLRKLKERNTQLTDARQRLAHAARHDALTGLNNRRAIYEYLSGETHAGTGGDGTIGLLKVDLDHFQEINDTMGHATGDQMLSHVAEILRRETNPHDIVGRAGGDEFIAIVTDKPNHDTLRELGERLISRIQTPVRAGKTTISLSASVGFTLAPPQTATPDQMLIEADLALYEAKRQGCRIACAYSDDMVSEIETRRTLLSEIRGAVFENAFEPYVQPQVFARTGALYGCEVLARWRHPSRGMLAPGAFIAAAEEAQLVDQIDLAMMMKGLDFLEAAQADGIELPTVSINASPPTLRDIHFTERLLQEVRARHLTPHNLIVEVLESTLIEGETDVALQNIEAMVGAGFRVVLDDFGTGYASMSNLSRLRLSGLKLDQSLIKPLPNPRAVSIVSAMTTLARNLRMSVVAEGVETAAHLAFVGGIGCDVAQGYEVGKPMPLDAFAAWYHKPAQQRAASG